MGHPIYALSVVLFSLILSTGLGSLLSEKLMPARPVGILFWLSLLVIYLLALPHWLPALTHSGLESAGLINRSLVSIAVILPAGVLMGFGFPFGMLRLHLDAGMLYISGASLFDLKGARNRDKPLDRSGKTRARTRGASR